MSYAELRHFADSYGLAVMALAYLVLVGWALRPGARGHHRRAAQSIFEEERNHG